MKKEKNSFSKAIEQLDGWALYTNRLSEEAMERLDGAIPAAQAKEIMKVVENLLDEVDVRNRNAIFQNKDFMSLFLDENYDAIAYNLRLVYEGRIRESVFADDPEFVKKFNNPRARQDAGTMATVFRETGNNEILKKVMGAAFTEQLAGFTEEVRTRGETFEERHKIGIRSSGNSAISALDRRTNLIGSCLANKLIFAINEGDYCNEEHTELFQKASAILGGEIKKQTDEYAISSLIHDQEILDEMHGHRKAFAMARHQSERAAEFRGVLNQMHNNFRRVMNDPDEQQAARQRGLL